jgi:MFS transporter, ACS family, hexuronate transporter
MVGKVRSFSPVWRASCGCFFWGKLYTAPESSAGISPGELAWINSDKDEAVREVAPKTPWSELLRYRETWGYILVRFITDPVWWFFLIWLPDYFKASRHLDIKNSWVHLASIYGIVTIGSILAAWITGRLASSGWSVTKARKWVLLGCALLVTPILFVTKCSDWGAVALIGLAGAAHQAWSANCFSTVSDIFPNRLIASVVGIGGMAGSISGFMFPVICGRVLDHYTELGNVSGGYAVLFGFCGVAYLLGFGIHHLLVPRFEPRAR